MSISIEDIEVRFCRTEESGQLRAFIDEHWASGHVLSESKALLDWQHLSVSEERYNFVVAVSPGDQILGVIGFITTSYFDPSLAGNDSVWLALWKVREDISVSALGLLLLNFLEEELSPNVIGTLGINQDVARLYRALGYHVGSLEQYYLQNPEIETFEIAEFPESEKEMARNSREKRFELRELGEYNLEQFREQFVYEPHPNRFPRKSLDYFMNRFVRHPFYDYEVWGVAEKEEVYGLLAVRAESVSDTKALRIVDFYGESQIFSELGRNFEELLLREEAEYVDIIQKGLRAEDLSAAGFKQLDPEGDVIIPNYFEPFERRNIVIDYAYKPGSDGHVDFRIFIGDGDQDRPNNLE